MIYYFIWGNACCNNLFTINWCRYSLRH